MTRTKDIPHTFSDSGISVNDSITLSVSKKILPLKQIILMGITLLGIFGCMNVFISYFDFNYDKNTLNMYTLIFFAVFSLILNLPKKLKLLILPVCILYETIFVRQRETFIDGFKVMYNVIAQKFHITGEGIMYYRLDSNVNQTLSLTVFFVFASFILTLLICYATYCNPHFIIGIIITFIPVEVGLYFGIAPSYPAFIMVVAYWVSLVAIGVSGCRDSNYQKEAGFIRKDNNFYAKSHIKFRVGEFTGFITVCVTFVLFLILMAAVRLTGYERSYKADEIRTNVQTSISEFSVDNIPASMSKLAASFGNFSVAPGKLGQFSNLNFNNEVDLQVTFDKQLYSEVYMKCYTGSYYTGDEWDDFPKSIYNNYNTMFNSFENLNIYPQNFLNIASSYLPDAMKCNVKIQSLMKNTRYIYTPYGTDVSGFAKEMDTETNSDNVDDYSLDFIYTGSYENFISSKHLAETENNTEFQEFSNVEKTYRDFVYSEYLQLPDNDDIEEVKTQYNGLISNALSRSSAALYTETNNNDGNIEIFYDNEDIYTTLSEIKSAISFDTEYTLSPGKTPSTRDFVNYFLLENKKGYCSHYASAGVMLARMCGIPARYAEGYIVTGNDFVNGIPNQNGSYTIGVKDSRAHAWAEIYINGFGWIPFEFTPGYDSGIVPTETTIAQNKITVYVNDTTTSETTSAEVTTESISEEILQNTEITEVTTDISGTVSSDYNGGGIISSSDDDISNKLKNQTISLLLIILLIAFAIVSAFALRRHYNVSKRKKSFMNNSPDENVVNAYLYIISLLEFMDIKNYLNMPYLDFAEYVEENTDFFKTGEFINATRIALKSDLSKHEVSKKESEKIIRLAEHLEKEISKKIDNKQKFYLKYISNLS